MTKSPKPFQDHFHFKKWLTVYPNGDISKQVTKEKKSFEREKRKEMCRGGGLDCRLVLCGF